MEADATGTSLREYIWFDDMPLAVLEAPASPSPQLMWVHADHLDRPVKITDGNQAVVWDAVWKRFVRRAAGAMISFGGRSSGPPVPASGRGAE